MRPMALAGCTLALLMATPDLAAAQNMSDLHAKVRVGTKLCMADHYHSGNSADQPSKAAAEKAAIRNWEEFTSWEYGGAWGSYAAAVGKTVKCSGSGSSWGCFIEARPCRSAESPRRR